MTRITIKAREERFFSFRWIVCFPGRPGRYTSRHRRGAITYLRFRRVVGVRRETRRRTAWDRRDPGTKRLPQDKAQSGLANGACFLAVRHKSPRSQRVARVQAQSWQKPGYFQEWASFGDPSHWGREGHAYSTSLNTKDIGWIRDFFDHSIAQYSTALFPDAVGTKREGICVFFDMKQGLCGQIDLILFCQTIANHHKKRRSFCFTSKPFVHFQIILYSLIFRLVFRISLGECSGR